jgi:hypothetical protein
MSTINASKIVPIVVVGIAILLAWIVGNGVADQNYNSIALSLGALVVIAMVGLGSRFYILIPICWGLTGQISVLPLPFSVRQLVIILASVIFIQGAIFKTIKKNKTSSESIDIWIWVNIIYIIIVFFRNPVGINALGGDRVGGKPYVDVALGLMCYLILRKQRISGRLALKLPKYILFVSVFTAIAGAIGFFLPQVGDELSLFYSTFSSTGTIGITADYPSNFSAGARWVFMQGLGISLILYVVCACNPGRFMDINNLRYAVLYVLGIIAILTSGFRSAIIQGLMMTTVAVMARDWIMGLFKLIIAVFFLASGAIAISYLPIKLPTTFQRALSFLPGNWEQVAILDAQDTTDWRLEMWKLVLSSDRYIHNKILGDGFGYLRADFERSLEIASGKEHLSQTDAQQEVFMIDGDFHSGPIGAIRFVGVVGLALLLPVFFLSVKMALSLIKSSKGTNYEFSSFFFSIPVIISPFFFVFVIGDYRQDLVTLMFSIGMMGMLKNSISESKKA